MREQEQPEQRPLPIQRGGEPPPSAVESAGQSNGKTRRVINRQEYEIPKESDRWFNAGLAIVGIAACAAIAAVGIANGLLQAVLGTLAVCLLAGGVACFFVDREVNRGRRAKRSQVIEEVEEA